MKKLHIFNLALVAVFAFGALTVASASAVEFLLAEWLVNGSPVTTELATDSEGELLFEETVLGIKIDALCSGILDGTIGANGADLITALLNLAGGEIPTTELVEPGIACTNDLNCPEPLAWADKLPWESLLELMVDGTETFFVDLLIGAGYHIVCMGTGTSDLCTAAESVTKITTEGTNLDAE